MIKTLAKAIRCSPIDKHSQAIISKPGGGTLVDSLSAVTPLILLDPYGEYERENGQLWQELGFAITYQQWADSNYSFQTLENLQTNLRESRSHLPQYIDSYIDRYSEVKQDSKQSYA